MFKFLERLPLHQLFIVTLVGVSSGLYIYRPLLEEYDNKRKEAQKQNESKDETKREKWIEPRNCCRPRSRTMCCGCMDGIRTKKLMCDASANIGNYANSIDGTHLVVRLNRTALWPRDTSVSRSGGVWRGWSQRHGVGTLQQHQLRRAGRRNQMTAESLVEQPSVSSETHAKLRSSCFLLLCALSSLDDRTKNDPCFEIYDWAWEIILCAKNPSEKLREKVTVPRA